MDRPATVAAALLGVALIAISVPFLSASGEGGTEYAITWAQEADGSGTAQAAAANTDATVTVVIQGRHPSNATINFDPCADAAAPPLQQPATITWSLREGNNTVRENQQATCANNGPFTVELHPHPDIGSIEADSAEAAEADAESYPATTTYTLTFRWSRPAGATGPIPLPPPAFTATGELEVQVWNAVANAPDEEVPR